VGQLDPLPTFVICGNVVDDERPMLFKLKWIVGTFGESGVRASVRVTFTDFRTLPDGIGSLNCLQLKLIPAEIASNVCPVEHGPQYPSSVTCHLTVATPAMSGVDAKMPKRIAVLIKTSLHKRPFLDDVLDYSISAQSDFFC
jgi:hypothetical protein